MPTPFLSEKEANIYLLRSTYHALWKPAFTSRGGGLFSFSYITRPHVGPFSPQEPNSLPFYPFSPLTWGCHGGTKNPYSGPLLSIHSIPNIHLWPRVLNGCFIDMLAVSSFLSEWHFFSICHLYACMPFDINCRNCRNDTFSICHLYACMSFDINCRNWRTCYWICYWIAVNGTSIDVAMKAVMASFLLERLDVTVPVSMAYLGSARVPYT